MEMIELIPLSEVADIFCMSEEEFKEFIQEREFNLGGIEQKGEIYFSMERVQSHLRSQYFH